MEKQIADKLKNLREQYGFSLQQLADQVEVSKQSIHKFEAGIVRPSSETLLKLADALNVPYSFFYETVDSDSFLFNNIKFREGHKLFDRVDFENEVKEEVMRYLSKFMQLETIMGIEHIFENPLSDLEIATDKDIEKAAKLLRKKWKLGNAPIVNVVETLETNGVFVVEITRADNFTGLSAKVNEEIPIIVLNENAPVERKRFTALHELGHVVLEFVDGMSEEKLEFFCNSFAGAVLLVDEMLFHELGKNRTTISLAELRRIKEIYGISIQAVIVRAGRSGFIDDKTYKEWWDSYKEWTTGDTKPSDFGNYRCTEKPTRFRNLLERGVTEKRVSISKAAEIMGEKVDVMRKQLDQLKFIIK